MSGGLSPALSKREEVNPYPIRVYIAGKVTGERIDHCTMKFGAAQKRLEALGYEVINPLTVVNDWQTPWHDAMKLCFNKLIECDGIHLLPDWKESRGARIEAAIALEMEFLIIK